jgi:peptide/nickel transport system substrate-binding protein
MLDILRRSRVARFAALGAIAALTAAGCSSTSTTSSSSTPAASGAKVPGGVVTIADVPGAQPDYIFPFVSIANISVYTAQQFQYLLYRPLYMFGGENSTSVSANYALSPADAPTYSGNTVTVNFKGWKWSDGESVDAKDMVFWLNMMEAEKANFYGYTPGLAPDNLVSYSATGPNTLTITTKTAYSSLWFTYNQLGMMTPMPEAWDVTSLGAAPGSGGCASDSAADKWAKCVAVYNFLTAQAKDSSTYASSPLWSVVDGPWKMSSFNSDGDITLVPNSSYSGSPKPSISELKYVSYADDSDIYTALKTGSLDIGQIPQNDLNPPASGAVLPSVNPLGSSYDLQAFYSYGFDYANPNYNGPNAALWKQLYVRQAFQELVDQPGMDKAIFHGYGYIESGAVPTEPVTQWLPSVEKENGGAGPYGFNISGATSLLTSHGWKNVGGVMTCESPGTGSNQCGAGIASGRKMSFNVDFASDITSSEQEAQVLKSDASQAGVQINLIGEHFDVILSNDVACNPGPKCTWDLAWAGGWAYDGPGWEPTGEPLFATGAGSNTSSYSDPQMDSLIHQTETSSSLSTFGSYASYVAQQLPFIWTPNVYDIIAVSAKLQGVAQNPDWDLLPEYWYWTK